jgi:hypothetical protein
MQLRWNLLPPFLSNEPGTAHHMRIFEIITNAMWIISVMHQIRACKIVFRTMIRPGTTTCAGFVRQKRWKKVPSIIKQKVASSSSFLVKQIQQCFLQAFYLILFILADLDSRHRIPVPPYVTHKKRWNII